MSTGATIDRPTLRRKSEQLVGAARGRDTALAPKQVPAGVTPRALVFATSATDDACRPADDGERPADRALRVWPSGLKMPVPPWMQGLAVWAPIGHMLLFDTSTGHVTRRGSSQ
jgi:hypothetical protein